MVSKENCTNLLLKTFNFLKGYKNKKKFIATQGPKDCTQADFWRMVWEQDARIIVMITKLQEGSQVFLIRFD